MKNVYACPHCAAVLNPSVKILLVVGCKRKKGLILLSPQPGNFKHICEPKVEECMRPGNTATFQCPVCSADLTSPVNKGFARLHLLNPDGPPKVVEFSRVYGQHATFIISGDEVTAFGEDVERIGPRNFFGA